MKRNLTISCSTVTTNVLIRDGLLFKAGKYIQQKRAVIITDDNASRLYLNDLMQALETNGIEHHTISIGVGESAKNLQTVEKIYAFLHEKKINRSDCIISLGGGVVGDIAGFVAATFMRGVTLIHIPTTIIAQTDSSIGGKCGVNYNGVKNLIGAFYQPSLVLIDTGVLKTLSKRDFNSGMAEVIKYAALFDKNMFWELECTPYDLEEIIFRCCKLKAVMVELDEFDKKERHILNFGHTFGHSIEATSNYELTHGEAVAIGMVIATRLGEKLKITKEGTTQRLISLLNRFSLPTSTTLDVMYGIDSDKKAEGKQISIVSLQEIGKVMGLSLTIDRLKDIIGDL
ncbi:MAG: 3-dehydroquinate synthase [Clostridiales bacterium]|nr:3-dehydroquinate synthase [Clostridiales bacterium]